MKNNTKPPMQPMDANGPITKVMAAEREWQTSSNRSTHPNKLQAEIERVMQKHGLMHLCTIQTAHSRPFLRWHIMAQMMQIVFRDLKITPPDDWSLVAFYEWEVSTHAEKHRASPLGRVPNRDEWAEAIAPYAWATTLWEPGAPVKYTLVITHQELYRQSGMALAALYTAWRMATSNLTEPHE